MASDSDSSDCKVEVNNSQGSTPGKSGRKNIRKVLKDKQVAEDTKLAAKEEEERLKRIAERQALVYLATALQTFLMINIHILHNYLFVTV